MSDRRKQLGQFFTPTEVARSLVSWLELSPQEAMLDPSCGDGQFLRWHKRSVGIEVDPINAASARVRAPSALIHGGDFFTWALATKERFPAIAGNPPFIRYQSFSGDLRHRALNAAKNLGADYSGLASSWAPFITVASGLLTPGGRMAFVVPAEIGHATYAPALVRSLCRTFGKVQIVACREKLFPALSEDCWLLFCGGYGQSTDSIALTVVDIFSNPLELPRTTRLVSIDQWEAFGGRLRPFLLSTAALDLYRETCAMPSVRRLGTMATASVGYVSGANDFFHLRPSEVARRSIPKSLLRVAVRKSEQLPESVVDREVVESWLKNDDPVMLLDLRRARELPKSVLTYLDEAAGHEVRKGYKCSNRSPWYGVPDVTVPDAFLSVMSGRKPALVRNAAGCVCTNTLHAVRFKDGIRAEAVQEGWASPLAQLGTEIEGHPLGGGMLKLEPREAARVPVPMGQFSPKAAQADTLLESLTLMRHWRHHA